MKQEKYGRIINIISTSVKIPLQGLGVSNTIRGAVASWSKTLATELASFGITVNNILPGATSTERLDAIILNKSTKAAKAIDEIAIEMQNEIPMKRFGKPAEIANAVGFLASPAASYISGINLPVDGGRTGCL
jgi:3-oxoacyl-[acyl-carrier protein] reductase